MLFGKKVIFNLLAALFAISTLYFISNNFDVTISFKLFTQSFEDTYLGLALIVPTLLTGLAVYFRMLVNIAQSGHDKHKLDRQREKAEVGAEESAGKIKALEAKIETLETALDNALKSSSESISS